LEASATDSRTAPGADATTLAAVAGVVLFGGINAIAVKQTVQELAPFWAAGSRFIAAGLILVLIVVITRRSLPRGRSLAGALAYGLIGFAAPFGLVYPALREAPAGTAALFFALVPLLTFGLAIAHGQERFRVQGLVGGLVAVAGVALVFADQLSADVPAGSLAAFVFGVACIAETGVIVKLIPRSDPFGTNAVAMMTGTAVVLPLSLVTGEPWTLPVQTETWVAAGYLVVFGSVALFALYLFALSRWTASAVSYVDLLFPLVTISAAALLTGERISLSLVIGGAIILAGVYIGAFLKLTRPRPSASSLPECFPVEACAPPEPATSRSGAG
jgi:drug/metabolite transporter (DMT)-like permease